MKLQHVIDSQFWLDLFCAKAIMPDKLPWDDNYRISSEERQTITSSIQQFHLGENSEGRSFLAAARHYAEYSGDLVFPAALKTFIQEEQRHSRMLGRFMNQQDIPILEKHWVDETFRKLRKLAGLEVFVIVLVSAELVAKPYYRSLRRATDSPLLKAICTQILKDEAHHICFQASTLRKLRKNRLVFFQSIVSLIHFLFMVGTCLVVWHGHKKVLDAGRYTLFTFTINCLKGVHALNHMAALPISKGQVVTKQYEAHKFSWSV